MLFLLSFDKQSNYYVNTAHDVNIIIAQFLKELPINLTQHAYELSNRMFEWTCNLYACILLIQKLNKSFC